MAAADPSAEEASAAATAFWAASFMLDWSSSSLVAAAFWSSFFISSVSSTGSSSTHCFTRFAYASDR